MLGALKKLEQLIKWGIFLVFAFMIAAVVIQVFGRTFMAHPPIWTEEAARVTLLYIVGLGVGAAVLTGDLVNVDLALVLMPKPVRRMCELISAALVSLFGFFMVPGAWEFTVSGAMQTSPTLETPMQYIFGSMLFFAVLLGTFGLVKFIDVLFAVPGKESTSPTH